MILLLITAGSGSIRTEVTISTNLIQRRAIENRGISFSDPCHDSAPIIPIDFPPACGAPFRAKRQELA
jgi:hypothetical protein